MIKVYRSTHVLLHETCRGGQNACIRPDEFAFRKSRDIAVVATASRDEIDIITGFFFFILQDSGQS